MTEAQQSLQKLVSGFREALRKQGGDLSSDEDLSIGVMNLISIEEHLFFTAEKTGKREYLELLDTVRAIRAETMKTLLPVEPEGETWCISKHLLAASMRLMEVGTKKLREKKHGPAQRLFDQAYQLYTLFWSVRLGVGPVDRGTEELSSRKTEELSNRETEKQKGDAVMDKEAAVREFVNKLVDCCDE